MSGTIELDDGTSVEVDVRETPEGSNKFTLVDTATNKPYKDTPGEPSCSFGDDCCTFTEISFSVLDGHEKENPTNTRQIVLEYELVQVSSGLRGKKVRVDGGSPTGVCRYLLQRVFDDHETKIGAVRIHAISSFPTAVFCYGKFMLANGFDIFPDKEFKDVFSDCCNVRMYGFRVSDSPESKTDSFKEALELLGKSREIVDAVVNDDMATLRLLVDELGPDILTSDEYNYPSPRDEWRTFETLIEIAIYHNSRRVFQFLLDKTDIVLQEVGSSSNGVIHLVAEYDRPDLLEILLKHPDFSIPALTRVLQKKTGAPKRGGGVSKRGPPEMGLSV